MPEPRSPAAVLALLTEKSPSVRARERQYLDWCVANGLSPLPDGDVRDAGETQLLRYLHAFIGAGRWSYPGAHVSAGVVARWFVSQGRHSPMTRRVRDYLRAVQRQTAGNQQRPVDAFTGAQILQVCRPDVLDTAYPRRAEDAAAAAVLVVAALTAGDPLPPAVLDDTSIRTRTADVVVEVGGRRLVVDPERSPLQHAILSRHAQTAVALARRRYVSLVRNAMVRIRVNPPEPRTHLRVDDIRNWWEAATPNQREWLILNVESPSLARRRADLALLTVGVVTGHRHAEFRRLTVGMVKPTTTGYTWTLAANRHKGSMIAAAKGGTPAAKTSRVDHLADDQRQCPPHCPACCLGDHLEVRQRTAGAGAGAPLFESTAAGKGPLGQQGASASLNRLWTLGADLVPAEESEQYRIGTRSWRVTAATLAHQSGMSTQEIAEEITGHRQQSTAARYIRRLKSYGAEDLMLGLDG